MALAKSGLRFAGGARSARAGALECDVVSAPVGPANTNNRPPLRLAMFQIRRGTASHRHRETFRRFVETLSHKRGWEIVKNRPLRSRPDATDGSWSGGRLHPA